ncbi:MAG TPA: L,D-transpeptidase family protein, partial [Reyranella sp.]|nr:L,D-transpeptidase family protein [Reyranella sp.]
MNRRIFLGAAMALATPLLGASPSFADEPLWTGSRAAEARTAALVAAIRAAGDHGLNPDWYGASVLDKAIATGDEKVLSDVFAAYASEVSTGRVNANRVDKDIDIQQRRVSRTDLLKAAAEAPDFATWLAALPPKGDYPVLQKELADMRTRRATEAYTPLPSGGALKPTMIDPRVPILRTRLTELGLTVPPAGDVAELYDEPLVAVVKAYQETKGLTVDGVIGQNTVRSLNTSIDDRIQQVIANLERRRWLAENLGRRYVFVNAGDYSMVFVDGGQKVFESLVIVGTPKNPTPEIQTVMRGFQTNPYWTVPQSISGEEYLPMLRRDPYALQNNGFRIFESWSSDDSEIDPGTVDWNSINPKAFPFRIRQEPGAGNALGYI